MTDNDAFAGDSVIGSDREGVYAQGGHAFLAHTKQKVSNIVDLTVLRLAFFMGYE